MKLRESLVDVLVLVILLICAMLIADAWQKRTRPEPQPQAVTGPWAKDTAVVIPPDTL